MAKKVKAGESKAQSTALVVVEKPEAKNKATPHPDPQTTSELAVPEKQLPATSKRGSKIDAYASLLGTVIDGEVAKRAGVSNAAITQYRKARGIPPFRKPREAPRSKPPHSYEIPDESVMLVAEPPAAYGAAVLNTSRKPTPMVFEVTVKTSQGLRDAAVVGNDMKGALETASQHGEVISITKHRPLLG